MSENNSKNLIFDENVRILAFYDTFFVKNWEFCENEKILFFYE